jgi:A/G-specific adenine glycosylase
VRPTERSKLILDYVTAVISRQSASGPEYFLVQRPDTGLLAGLWDFPNAPLDDPETEESLAQEVLLEHLASLGLPRLGILARKGSSLHIFTHIRRTSLVYAVQVTGPPGEAEVGKWVTEEEIVDMAVSELGRKVLRLALGTEKRKAEEKVKNKSRKVIKLEKGQTKLSFGS